MIRLLMAGTIVAGLLTAEPTFAQPSTEDVVNALVPTKTRVPRGLTMEG